ncbi:MAG: hypothetical protein LBB86_00070, partial [Oscillospiraceae bacterium]|nr:hypothetical protein [Oscillospiraceae bacterium]
MNDRDQKRLDARLRRSGEVRGKYDRSSTNSRKRRLPAIADAAAPTDIQGALAARVPGDDVIFNYASAPNQLLPVEPSFLEWELRKDHPGYDIAYTMDLSAQYNHEATPDHVVFNGQDISFFGYPSKPYYDYVFSDVYDSYGSAFILRPKNMNFHSFRQTGYLFNGQMTEAGGKTYYTGFALILECDNIAGMQENDADAPNIAALRLYYLKNEEWNTDAPYSNWYSDTFPPSATRTHITTIKNGIENLSTDPFRVSVETDPVNPAFKVYVDGSIAADLSEQYANDYIGGDTQGSGFGFFTSYYSHSCSILTRITYEQTAFGINYAPLERTKATVRFAEQSNPAHVLRAPETEEGWFYQQYRIRQPQTIVDADAVVWYLSGNSLDEDTGSDIHLTYLPAAEDNETTLFYVQQGSGKPIEEEPVKTARVNGGEWEVGSDLAPITVAPGDEIEYSITVFGIPPGS